ncbi:MAG: RidA family protein [Proteobacteria bacterium]|nr:MAG: RidA family protein [Pseudomonadota bacterium]QKK10428.1 MAG: RidA family protein [Pseudomonadota bacterium]
MTEKTIIQTDKAPAAIGPYSQAVRAGNTVYCSGQIPLDPATMELVMDSFEAQAVRVFDNLAAVAAAAGGTLADFVKLNIYLTDLTNFGAVNEVMMRYFQEPYPARAAVGVKELPKGVDVEVEGVMVL